MRGLLKSFQRPRLLINLHPSNFGGFTAPILPPEFPPLTHLFGSFIILDLVTRWRSMVIFKLRLLHSPKNEPSVPIEYVAVWTPEPVWTLWRREKFLAFAGNRTPPNPSGGVSLYQINYLVFFQSENRDSRREDSTYDAELLVH
jgi:hypothetical protein